MDNTGAIRQMLAQHPQLALQAAVQGYQLGNQQKALAYQPIDRLQQSLLQGLGIYGDMKAKEEDTAFKKKQFEASHFVELAKLRQSGALADAQIRLMESEGTVNEEQATRLRMITPEEVAGRQTDTDLKKEELREFQRSEPYRRALEDYTLLKTNQDMTRGDAEIKAIRGDEGRKAALHEGAVEQQGLQTDLMRQEHERIGGAMDREAEVRKALAGKDISDPAQQGEVLQALALFDPNLAARYIQGDQEARAKASALMAKELDGLTPEAKQKGDFSKRLVDALLETAAALKTLQGDKSLLSPDAFKVELASLEAQEGALHGIASKMLKTKEEGGIVWDVNKSFEQIFAEELAAQMGAPASDTGGTTGGTGVTTALDQKLKIAEEAGG